MIVQFPAGVPGGAHTRAKRAKELRRLRKALRHAESRGEPTERIRQHMASVLRGTAPAPRPRIPPPLPKARTEARDEPEAQDEYPSLDESTDETEYPETWDYQSSESSESEMTGGTNPEG